MKVVLLCGGRGTRLNGTGGEVPKPMLPIGYRPILWHIMKYYACFGHKDFILCLGYRADVIKNYFLHYDEAVSNDFVLSRGGRNVQLMSSDIDDWTITFVDTGVQCEHRRAPESRGALPCWRGVLPCQLQRRPD